MGRWKQLVVLGLILAGSSPAFASVGITDKNGVQKCSATDIRSDSLGANCTGSEAKFLVERRVDLDLTTFTVVASGTSEQALTQSTDPRLFKDGTSKMAFIRFYNGITDPIQKKFRIPANYASGGAFRLLMRRSAGTSTPPAMAWTIYSDADVTAFDTAGVAQTAVSMDGSTGSGSPQEKIFTISGVTLSAGKTITVEFSRAGTGTEVLDLFYAEFYYTAQE